MNSQKFADVRSLESYTAFLVHFCQLCYVFRIGLSVHLALVLLAGIGFSRCEGIPMSQGIYFSLITSTTVGYGDIAPATGLGQCLSILLAFLGTITFGLVVGLATRAVRETIREYENNKAMPHSNS